MSNELSFYIDGEWVAPVKLRRLDVIDPSTAEPFAEIALGTASDVDSAVAAARRAFPAFASTTVEERVELLERIIDAFKRRSSDLAAAVSREMGAPRRFALEEQVLGCVSSMQDVADALRVFQFDEIRGRSLIAKEPIGVVGLITPWNWPLSQIVLKIAPALAAGCTMVLKPSELAPLNAIILAEILHEAAVPKGVFNLVNGDGPTVGHAIAAHPGIDMVSFTGSTRAGILVAKTAADTVKRVHQELGGKSANILLPDVDFESAVSKGAAQCFKNSGQTCTAPTRMLVPRERQGEAAAYAKRVAETTVVGPPDRPDVQIGPVVGLTQFNKIQELIESGIAEGATLIAGGSGLPRDLSHGYFVRPTVFSDVTPEMRIAREEIFGPVLSIMAYDSEDEAIALANDTPYGLAAYVQGTDITHAREVASKMRAGLVGINYPDWDAVVPFGGYKQSGNGREGGEFGIMEFLELKAVLGYNPRPS